VQHGDPTTVGTFFHENIISVVKPTTIKMEILIAHDLCKFARTATSQGELPLFHLLTCTTYASIVRALFFEKVLLVGGAHGSP